MSQAPYDETFFQFHEAGSRRSAAATIPLVLDCVAAKSVVDIGCGIGTWLVEFAAAGVADYLGIDGDYVDRAHLLIPPERFLPRDLSQPLDVGRRFDLAVCLEVAEHIPAQHAGTLVCSLTSLASAVLFSAAIPFQSGTGHVNEQWPEYWRELFAEHDFVAVDPLRDRLWQNDDVETWYRQNLLFFVERARLARYPRLDKQFQLDGDRPDLSRVHPLLYTNLLQSYHDQLSELRRLNICSSLRLRDFNLLVFPDWRLPPAEVQRDLRALLLALVGHPQSQRVAVVINFGSDPSGAQLAEQVHREVNVSSGAILASARGISGVGSSFGPVQWEVLLECAQGRVILPCEDAVAIAAVKAGSLPAVTLEAIRSRQPLNFQPLAK